VTRRVAAVHLQLAVWHGNASAELDVMPPKRFVIARVRDDRDISIPIGFEYVGIIGIGSSAARNRWIIRHHKRLEPLRNRGIGGRPLPQIAGHKQGAEKHQRAHQQQHRDRAEVLHGRSRCEDVKTPGATIVSRATPFGRRPLT
jgi:hypothetical protein